MSRIDQLMAELCPHGVEFRKLEDCCRILDKLRKPVTKGARVVGPYPYYGANGVQDYVSDFIFDGTFVLVGEDGSVVTEFGKPVVNWASGKIWVNNHAHIIEEVDGILLRYLYHYLQTVDVRELIHGNIPKLNQGDFRQIQIAVPPLTVQEEIVRILDAFTELEAELEAELVSELEARKKQYEHYRDTLLDQAQGCRMPLGDCCDFVRGPFGGSLKKEIFVSKGYAVYEQQHAIHEKYEFRYFITEEKFKSLKRFAVNPGELIMSCSGTMGKVSIVPENAPMGVINQALLKLTPKPTMLAKYLKYYFESAIAKLMNDQAKGGAIKNVSSVSDLKAIEIAVPIIDEQRRIVDILDRFNALCNDISEGLPAEIEARRKQYEYYRDKLLTFKELEA